jgi:hypothetical protein
MKVVELSKLNSDKLKDFLGEISDHGNLKPAFFVGIDPAGEAVLFTGKMSWQEFAYVKQSFDMHCTRDWLGLLNSD